MYRHSKTLKELDPSKLALDPQAAGRFTPVGIVMSMWDVLYPWMLLFVAPFRVMSHWGCGAICDLLPPHLQDFTSGLPSVPLWVDIVIGVELGFYLLMRAKLAYLQSFDPLESSLATGNILTLEQRQFLWDRVMKAEKSNIAAFFESWFFDISIHEISQHELQNFICWAYFDGRNQEHLSVEEHEQLDSFAKHARRLIQMEKAKSMRNLALEDEKASPRRSRRKPRPSKVMVFDAHKKLLDNALKRSGTVPQAEMAQIMRKMTHCHDTMMTDESTRGGTEEQSKRFGRPTGDPLLGVNISPLTIHVIFSLAEVVLRLTLWYAGFQRCHVHKTVYYFHPGSNQSMKGTNNTPLVFIHGVGIGPVVYLPLIFKMLSSGRPIFVPEIAAIAAFRPWVFPGDCLNPDKVATTLSIMLASHGFTKATFAAHSFGTFWLSYTIKYAPDIVAGLVFIDPVCFCLHNSSMTRRMVYNQQDPGDVSYLIRTDMMVNWSVQRHFSWVRGNLLLEEMLAHDTPTVVFMSGEDQVAPSAVQESYLRRHEDCQVEDMDSTPDGYFDDGLLNVVVFRGRGHGDWVLNPEKTVPPILSAMYALCARAEAPKKMADSSTCSEMADFSTCSASARRRTTWISVPSQ